MFYDDEELEETAVIDYYGKKVKLKTTVAKSFNKATADLSKQGIDIKIADSHVSSDVKIAAKKVYDKELAEFNSKGYYKKGNKVIRKAPPKQAGAKSFHTRGQAIDLEQIKSMKNEKVYAALRAQGFKQHPNEWWHWSIGEFSHKGHNH